MQQSTPLHLLGPRLARPRLAAPRAPLPLDGGALKAGRVAGDGGEPALPEPAQDVGRRVDAEEIGVGSLGEGLLGLWGQTLVGAGEAAAEEEDVSRAEGDVGVVDHGLEVGEGDGGAAEGVGKACCGRARGGRPTIMMIMMMIMKNKIGGVAFTVGDVVEQDATAHDAAPFHPRVDAQDGRPFEVGLRAAAIKGARPLVAKVAKAVPLAAALGVEAHVVVVDAGGERVVVHVPRQGGPAKGRVGGLGQVPVEGDALPRLDLVAGGAGHGVGGEEVEGAEDVVRAVETPCVAGGAGLVEGEGVEGGSWGEEGG